LAKELGVVPFTWIAWLSQALPSESASLTAGCRLGWGTLWGHQTGGQSVRGSDPAGHWYLRSRDSSRPTPHHAWLWLWGFTV